MKLSHLLSEADVKNAFADFEIDYVTDKSENCREGCAFVCIKGEKHDGHDYVKEAKKNGASVIVTQKDLKEENQIVVGDTRKAYALMCSKFFCEPSKEMKVIGITGTNGKTTTANIIYSLLTLMGEKSGLVGTVENIIDGEKEESLFTTPDAYEFNRILRKMADCGTKYCVCEVSSQALSQKRTEGTVFETGVFTNITKEHLDYHKTFENYLGAKKRLFSSCKNAVINLDDPFCDRMAGNIPSSVLTFSTRKNEADITAKNIRYAENSVTFDAVMLYEIGRVTFSGIGEFSVRNALAALAVMKTLGFELCEICPLMEKVQPVKGRGEKLKTNTSYSVIVDYAHTPDALYNVLYALSKAKKGKLIVLFGCGGDRDKEKRPEMGKVVSAFADIAVVTDDNPRGESENEIISDILGGMNGRGCRIYVEKDRTQAIKLALSKAKKNDIVLLAGKGHEAYQIINNQKLPFDEREKVLEFLS